MDALVLLFVFMFMASLIVTSYFLLNLGGFLPSPILAGEKVLFRGGTHLVGSRGSSLYGWKPFSRRKMLVTNRAIYIGGNFRLPLDDVSSITRGGVRDLGGSLCIHSNQPIRQPFFTLSARPRFDKNGDLWLCPGIFKTKKLIATIDDARDQLGNGAKSKMNQTGKRCSPRLHREIRMTNQKHKGDKS